MDGIKFRQIRLSQKMTQEQFGEFLGLGQSTIANIEAGRNVITDRTRSRLAQLDDIEQVFSFLRRIKEIERIFPIKS